MVKPISNIVFTKNRPLQLEAYLESLYLHFPQEVIETYILYKREFFDLEYEQVFNRFSDCKVIREKDFHTDFFNILNQIKTKYILFGIDDVVYFDGVNLDVIDRCFGENGQDIFGFSLRFSCKNVQENDKNSPEIDKKTQKNKQNVEKTSGFGEEIYRLDWTKGWNSLTRYPFELCATIYPIGLVGSIITSSMSSNKFARKLFLPDSGLIKLISKVMKPRKILKKFGFFFNPNTLESWNCKWCQRNIDKIPHYIYFQKNCASAIQVNMVNTSTANEYDKCEWTVEKLNEMYKQGYRFDINKLKENKPADTHCNSERFYTRKTAVGVAANV